MCIDHYDMYLGILTLWSINFISISLLLQNLARGFAATVAGKCPAAAIVGLEGAHGWGALGSLDDWFGLTLPGTNSQSP